MRASGFNGLCIFRFACLLAMAVLISPLACLAQSELTENVAWGRVLLAEDDRPVRDARVQFLTSSSAWTSSTLTAADGDFNLRGLLRAAYQVTVTAPGCERLEATTNIDGRTGPLVLRLRKTQAPAGPRNGFVVSVQELKMSGKGEKSFDKGTRLLLSGNPEQSLEYFSRAVAENPDHYRAYHNLGLAHFQLGRLADAKQAFQKSIDLSGGSFAPPLIGLGAILWQKQEFRQAEMVIQKALELDPGSATGKYFLGLAQLRLKRLVEAERSVQEALLRRPNFAEAYFLLGTIHYCQHNPYAVVQDLQTYLKLAPHSRLDDEARSLLETAQREIAQNPPAVVAATAATP